MMKKFSLLLVVFVLTLNCQSSSSKIEDDVMQNEEGFLFVDISSIYHTGGELTITDAKNGDILVSIGNKQITINGKSFDVIDEEHLYSKEVVVDTFYPEYGLFILECSGLIDGNYQVKINNKKALISASFSKVDFKGYERFILETYPVPTESNPLREFAQEGSGIIANFSEYTFIPIAIEGDWVKVKDDKECYSGEAPSVTDITGWVRWRKNGKLILEVAHIC